MSQGLEHHETLLPHAVAFFFFSTKNSWVLDQPKFSSTPKDTLIRGHWRGIWGRMEKSPKVTTDFFPLPS